MGGPSALLFALRYPHRTRSLAMVSAASHAIPPRPAVLAAIFNVFLNDFVFWSLARWIPGGLLAALGVPLEVQKGLAPQDTARVHAFLESIMPMSARRNGQLLEQHMSEYEAEQIKNIRAPALVAHASDDTLIAFEQAEFTARNIPGAPLISLAKGGHLALMFEFNAVAREKVLEFLERYNGR
jgi:pimeloyl-ACP methyl ester carboxylesterase